MNEVKFLTICINSNFNLVYFSSLISDNLEVGITYHLLVEFIYSKPILDSLILDKPIIFKISETNSIELINKLYYFLLNKANSYNQIKIIAYNGKYKDLQAEVLLITYAAMP